MSDFKYSQYWYRNVRKILIMLAKRNGSKSDNSWYEAYEPIDYFDTKYRCLICGGSIEPYFNVISEHGTKHLKESNLLPFI